MKKNFYKIAMLLLVSGLLTVGCKKEKTSPTTQGQTTSVTAKPSGQAESSTPDAPAANAPAPPGGCPGHK
jgi:hypothetical protein